MTVIEVRISAPMSNALLARMRRVVAPVPRVAAWLSTALISHLARGEPGTAARKGGCHYRPGPRDLRGIAAFGFLEGLGVDILHQNPRRVRAPALNEEVDLVEDLELQDQLD